MVDYDQKSPQNIMFMYRYPTRRGCQVRHTSRCFLLGLLSIPREKVPHHSWKHHQFQDGTESGFLRDAILLLICLAGKEHLKNSSLTKFHPLCIPLFCTQVSPNNILPMIVSVGVPRNHQPLYYSYMNTVYAYYESTFKPWISNISR